MKLRLYYFYILIVAIFSVISSQIEDSSSFLRNYLHEDEDETKNENKINLSQIGHNLVSKTHFRNNTLMEENFSFYKVIEQNILKAFVGVVGTHLNNRTLIVSFRGTYISIQNILADAWNIITKVSGPSKCGQMEVHEGFLIALDMIKEAIFDEIKFQTNRLRNQLTQIIFTGHSLGGAMTTLAALEYLKLQENKTVGFEIPKVSVITFGQPRVGTQAFSKCLQDNLFHNYRIVYGKDPIPSNPTKPYLHSGTEIRYSQENFNHPKICDKNSDESDRENSIFSIYPDHTLYKYIDSMSIWEAIHKIEK